jgi:hypothetical protein
MCRARTYSREEGHRFLLWRTLDTDSLNFLGVAFNLLFPKFEERSSDIERS